MQMTEDRPGQPVSTSMCQRQHSPLDCMRPPRPEPTPSHTNPQPRPGRPGGRDRNAKKRPLCSPRPSPSQPHPPAEEGRAGPGGWAAQSKHLRWMFRGETCPPTCQGGRREVGWLGTGAAGKQRP
uniref:Uncharacterized protein n=1 Tax=Pipistrellus kuhlii TaxID=59472 RepID=A0A7J7UTD7_PIPKU|nr:hypothetical protein mPipKuh1_008681 [Pipistrellus kuhlii]